MKSAPRVLIALVSAVLVTGVLLTSGAQAITENSFIYTTARNGFLTLGPGDFVPESGDTEFSANQAQIFVSSNANQCFVANAHLPQGATITQVRVFYKRADETQLIFLNMRRVDLKATSTPFVAGDNNLLPVTSSSGGSINYSADPVLGVVNHAQYRYPLGLCIATSATFFTARVDYTYKNAGD